MIAEASNSFIGQGTLFSVMALGGLATLISIASFFATRSEVQDLKERVAKNEVSLDQVRRDIIDNGEVRKNFIINHVDEVRRELDAKINNLPAHIIKTLRDTGVIGGRRHD